jgi:hypothetical protein
VCHLSQGAGDMTTSMLTEIVHVDDASVAQAIESSCEEGGDFQSLGAQCMIKITPTHRTNREPIQETILRYASAAEDSSIPHALRLAEDLRRRAIETHAHAQVLILRGASRSGKTETMKEILSFYCNRDHLSSLLSGQFVKRNPLRPLGTAANPFPLAPDASTTAKRLCAATTLLQSFGQLKGGDKLTSAQVTQFVTLRFSPSTGKLNGCRVQALFPEQLTFNTKDSPLLLQCMVALHKREEVNLSSIVRDRFSFVKDSKVLSTQCNFHEELDYLHNMLVEVGGISQKHWDEFIQVVVAVMHLQSLTVMGGETAVLSSATKGLLSQAEDLLGLENNALFPVVLKRPDDRIGRPPGAMIDAKPAEARQTIELMCRDMLFHSLSHLLDLLAVDIAAFDFSENVYQERGFLHVLDPVGWERTCDKINEPPGHSTVTLASSTAASALPMLFRHWLEEKWSSLFVEKAFYGEIGRYAQEGVILGNVVVPNWSSALSMLEESQNGLLPLLEEISQLPKGDDKAYLDKLREKEREKVQHEGTQSLIKVASGAKSGRSSVGGFSLQHSFQEFAYDADNMILQQRQSNLSQAMVTVLQSSSSSLIEIVSTMINKLTTTQDQTHLSMRRVSAMGANKPGTISKEKDLGSWNKLKQSTNRLLQYLQSCTGYSFLLCISPIFPIDNTYSELHSLALTGLIGMVQEGFVYMKSYYEFYNSFRFLLPFDFAILPLSVSDDEDIEDVRILCQQLLQECIQLPDISKALALTHQNSKCIFNCISQFLSTLYICFRNIFWIDCSLWAHRDYDER